MTMPLDNIACLSTELSYAQSLARACDRRLNKAIEAAVVAEFGPMPDGLGLPHHPEWQAGDAHAHLSYRDHAFGWCGVAGVRGEHPKAVYASTPRDALMGAIDDIAERHPAEAAALRAVIPAPADP